MKEKKRNSISKSAKYKKIERIAKKMFYLISVAIILLCLSMVIISYLENHLDYLLEIGVTV